MKEVLIQKMLDFCSNGHTPLSLQRMICDNANKLEFTLEQVDWFKKYISRIRDIVNSEPGHKTILAFKHNGTHTSYSIKKMYKQENHASFADWLDKLEEIELLCRYDQEDGLTKWSKKKVYGINPPNKQIIKIILDVIQKKYYSSTI